MAIKPFTSKQKDLIEAGQFRHQQLAEKVLHGLGKAPSRVSEPKRHHYIASTPGAGKTYTVAATAAKHKVELIKIQGVASMNAVVIALATASYLKPDENLQVWIDDCDSLFMERDCLSVMKGVLDQDRNVLAWNKNMTAQISVYERSSSPNDQIKAAAMRAFQTAGSVGIEIPTDRMRFIITSNRFLAKPNSDLNTVRKMDEACIRDRINYVGYDLKKDESWGWTAYTLLQTKTLGLITEQKHVLLDWMYSNWESLPATSMRAVKDLIADMLNYPENYPDHWESRLSTGR